MSSFAVDAEPCAAPRLAAAALLFHLAAAGLPWLTGVRPDCAVALSLLALLGLWLTLGWVPGEHCRLQAVSCRDGVWAVRLRGETGWHPATPGRSRRVLPGWVVVRFHFGGRSAGWILSRAELGAGAFRRLKVRLRQDC